MYLKGATSHQYFFLYLSTVSIVLYGTAAYSALLVTLSFMCVSLWLMIVYNYRMTIRFSEWFENHSENLMRWTVGLSLNLSKCNVSFRTLTPVFFPYQLNDANIRVSDSVMDLGFIFNSRLDDLSSILSIYVERLLKFLVSLWKWHVIST